MIGMSNSKGVPSVFEEPELPSDVGNPATEVADLLRAAGTSEDDITRLLGLVKCDLEGWFSILEMMRSVCDDEVFGAVYCPLGAPPF